jgi:D-alanyl-D-alanine carboxypeptidase (penicillin-binding protein 5/6)
MINTILSLYVTGLLTFGGNMASPMHTMPWNGGAPLSASAVPQKQAGEIAPVIKAKAAIAVDLDNGIILYEKNIYDSLPIASLTKLMTAVVILEENNLSDTVKVSKNAAKTLGTKIWLAPGEKISVENLIYCILIPSANDAATALAEYNSVTIEKFAEKMNAKARDLGMLSTNFINPTGLNETFVPDEKVQKTKNEKDRILETIPGLFFGNPVSEIKPTQNISTAYDLALLSRYAYGKSIVRRTVVKKEMTVESTDSKIQHQLKNTNELLGGYLKILGLKTGTTDEAGECLITIIEDDKGNDILTVVLNSPERYTETKVLADWVFRAYKWN